MRAATAAILALGFAGCGGDARVANTPRVAAPDSASRAAQDAGSVDADSNGELAPLLALAARGSVLAPGMHELTSFEAMGEQHLKRELVVATDRDVCVRVLFAAKTAVHAWLEDARGTVLADGEPAESGVLGTHGPVCVRRGGAVVLHVESKAPARIRVASWSAP